MNFKRVLAGLVCAALLLALTPMALAASGPTLAVTGGSGSPGGTASVTVRVTGNPGLSSVLVYLYYDTSVFTVDPDADLKTSGAFATGGSLIGNTIAKAKDNGRYEGDQTKDGVLALWYSGSGQDVTGDGAVLTAALHIKSTAAPGSYPVEVGYSQADTCDSSGSLVSLSVTSGTVTVTSAASSDGQTGDDQTTGGQTDQTGTDSDEITFSDTAGHWAEVFIQAAAVKGLVVGYDGGYHPDATMTRAQFVTVLWRSQGSPAPSGKASFTDLPLQWYQDAIAWAEENNIVNGVGNGRFSPDGAVTREQIAATLYRMAGSVSGAEVMFTSLYDSQYPDSGSIGTWAKGSVYWAVYHEVYCGQTSVEVGTTLAPKAAASRAEIAVMMVKYLNQY